MIEAYPFSAFDPQNEESQELALLSIIAQSLFQPFSTEDNLLVILTALTSGSGVGFNRALFLRADGDRLRGDLWLGPESPEEARSIWEVLSIPGMGYVEIIEHNRRLLHRGGSLVEKARALSFPLAGSDPTWPARAAARREVFHVREASQEPSMDRRFLEVLRAEEFLFLPLFARDEILGVFVLDNAITGEPISLKAIKLANLCGLVAANFLYTSNLHRQLLDMERLAALGEMAAFMTHQLRNPVAAIGGFADQLLAAPGDETRLKRNVEIIRKEIRRLEDVLFKLAHFLKDDLHGPQPFDLPPVVSGVLEEPDLRRKGDSAEVRVALEPGLPAVRGDAISAAEAVRNLVDNAFDATPAGGGIQIRGWSDGEGWVVLEVHDDGPGLSPDVRDRLFRPFVSTKDKGLGLGLLYVKRVMDACGGRVDAESAPGKGTSFRLHFRVAEEGRAGS